MTEPKSCWNGLKEKAAGVSISQTILQRAGKTMLTNLQDGASKLRRSSL